MGAFRSQNVPQPYVSAQPRQQLVPLMVEDTTDPEEIFSRALGTLIYLRSLNGHLVAAFDSWLLDPANKPSMDHMRRAQNGYDVARSAKMAMANLLEMFPTTNKYVLALTEADRMGVELATRIEESKTMMRSDRMASKVAAKRSIQRYQKSR